MYWFNRKHLASVGWPLYGNVAASDVTEATGAARALRVLCNGLRAAARAQYFTRPHNLWWLIGSTKYHFFYLFF